MIYRLPMGWFFSKNSKSRLQVVRKKLEELKQLAAEYPFLHIENLAAFEASVRSIEAKTLSLPTIPAASSKAIDDPQDTHSPIGKTIGDLQSEPMSAWGNADIITGLRFCATMQLRTPLRVLARHGEIHTDRTKPPPKIALEMWEGIWMPTTDLFKRLGIDDGKHFTMASDVGSIPSDGGDYLKFLIEVRQVVEGTGSVEFRREALGRVLAKPVWERFVLALQGANVIQNRFFPPFILTIPRVSAKIAGALSKLGYDTPASLRGASDDQLLAVSGIGPSLVKIMRVAAANASDPDSKFLDRVIR